MQMNHDAQRNRVYTWEQIEIAPKDKSSIPFNQAQSIVNYVWEQMGLKFPPQIRELHASNTRAAAKGGRIAIYIRENVSTRILLHELAHSMTSDHDHIDGHGADFVGVYFKLLEKFMGVPGPFMMYTLNKYNIKFNLGAQPWCL